MDCSVLKLLGVSAGCTAKCCAFCSGHKRSKYQFWVLTVETKRLQALSQDECTCDNEIGARTGQDGTGWKRMRFCSYVKHGECAERRAGEGEGTALVNRFVLASWWGLLEGS